MRRSIHDAGAATSEPICGSYLQLPIDRLAEEDDPTALPSGLMTDEKHEQHRADRNHERSDEAHWQVAEAGAEEDRLSEPPGQSDEQQDDWEDEGGALDREPKERTEPPRE